MSRTSHRQKRGLWIAVASLALAALFVTVNSLLPTPITPALTWQSLLQQAGVNQTTSLPDGELQVHFLDVGNADSALIRCGTHQMLIDGGEPSSGKKVVDYLRGQGVDRLDYVIATHPDADHIGGLPDVLEAFPVDRVLMHYMDDDNTPTSYSYERLLTTMLDRDIPVTDTAPGQQYALGDATVDILGPQGDFVDSNNMSVVCRVSFGNRRFLMMGDAEKKAENALISSGTDLRADVLKVGHHGSHSSTSSTFLATVAPDHAVISCGENNRYGHPHPETLALLQQRHTHIWRTDRQGTIVMTTDGDKLTVTTETGKEPTS